MRCKEGGAATIALGDLDLSLCGVKVQILANRGVLLDGRQAV